MNILSTNYFHTHFLFIAFLFICIPNTLLAQQRVGLREIGDISSFSEEIVSTASKLDESLSDAPGVITVINASEIERFGANNLREILDRVVNVLNIGSYLYPQNVTSVRGDLLSHIDNHILLLLNGRPMREALTGGINSTIYLSFPISAIQRLEVVRGPGSVLYGTNAYAGVINIITKTSKNLDFSATSGAGSFGTINYEASTAAKINDWNFMSAVHYLKSDGWNFTAKDEIGQDINTKYGETNFGTVLTINKKSEKNSFSFNSFVGFSDQDNLGTVPIITLGPTQKNQNVVRGFADIGYERQIILNKWQSNLNLNYNYMKQYAGVGNDPYEALANDILLEFTNYIKPVKKINIVLGGTGYFQYGRANLNASEAVPSYEEFWWSAYTQVDYKPFDKLKFVVGGQINKTPRADIDFVPRVGLIYNIIKNKTTKSELTLKVLYGRAFRSSFAAENFIKVGALTGNPALTPEKVSTLDIQLLFNTKNIQLGINYFHSDQDNIITRISNVAVAGGTIYANQGQISSQGLEAEFKVNFKKSFFFTGSYSFHTNILNDTIKEATQVPQTMVKLGVNYRFRSILSIGVFNSYIAAAGDVSAVNPSRVERNPLADAYNFMTIKANLDIFKLFKQTSGYSSSLSLSFYCTNVLDQKIYYPEFSRRNVNTLPGRSGIAYYGYLTFKF